MHDDGAGGDVVRGGEVGVGDTRGSETDADYADERKGEGQSGEARDEGLPTRRRLWVVDKVVRGGGGPADVDGEKKGADGEAVANDGLRGARGGVRHVELGAC